MIARTLVAAALASLALQAAPSSALEGGVEARVRVDRVLEGRSTRPGFWARLTGAPRTSDPVLARPYGVAWDGDDLLVTDPGAGRLVRFDAKGRAESSAAGALSSPIGVASCPLGLLVADSRTGDLWLFDRELRPVRAIASSLSRPTGVACRGDRLFVAETGAHRVIEFDAQGRMARTFGQRGARTGELNFPAALAEAGDSIWVGDTMNFRVQRYSTTDGFYRSAFGRLGDAVGETPRVKGIAVDSAGRLWVTDAHLDAVALFSADGGLLLEIGRHGSRPGEFSFPAGVAAHADGRIAVADSFNRRVQVLRLDLAGSGGAP